MELTGEAEVLGRGGLTDAHALEEVAARHERPGSPGGRSSNLPRCRAAEAGESIHGLASSGHDRFLVDGWKRSWM